MTNRAFHICLSVLSSVLFPAEGRAEWPDLQNRDVERQQALRPRLEAIPKDHPRLFLTEEDLPALRERIASDPKLNETYGWLLEWAQGSQYYTNLWVTGYQLEAAALVYLIEGRSPALLQRCLVIMDDLCTRQVGRSNEDLTSWTAPIVSRGLAVAYDWLYPDLTPEQRRKYGQKALDAAKVQYDRGTHRHSDYNNHLYLEYGRVTYAGIALYNDGIEDGAAEQFALDGLELMIDHFIPAHNQVGAGDGGWHESMSYHAFFTYEFSHQLEAWSVALDEDLWDGFIGLDGDAAWLLYNTRPFDSSRVGVADIHTPSPHGSQVAAYMPLLERRLRDGVAGWMADHIRSRDLARNDITPHEWAPYVLWTDPTVANTVPRTLPLARIFRGLGWASMRSSWDTDATFALFISGDYYAGHQHMDQNSFLIHKHAPLAIDAGEYGAKATVYHNTVLIGEGQRYYRNDPRQFHAKTEPGSEFDTGDIVAFQSNEHFTYVAGDASNAHGEFAYDKRVTQPVELALRQFVHLRPDLFVVYDRVSVKDTATPVTWLLHSEDAAEIDGDLVTVTHGKGRLYSRTVLPHRPVITGENQVGGKESREDYLIRVPSPSSLKHEFLHVLYATDSATGEMPVVESILVPGKNERVGVRILQEDGEAVVIFHRSGEPGGSVTISEHGEQIGRWELENEVVAD